MSSNVPLARQQLEFLLTTDLPPEVREALQRILPLLRRTTTKKVRAKIEAVKVDAFTAQRIRKMSADFPGASLMTLAKMFGTNPGRVSEAIAGLR